MALKSLRRGDWRVVLLTVTMLILVYVNLVFTPSLLAGAVQRIHQRTRDTLSADLVFQAAGDVPVITGSQMMVSGIELLDGVEAACARNSVGGEIRYEGERFTSAVYAIDPVRDARVFSIYQNTIDGSYLEQGDTGQVYLGVQVAGAGRTGLELYPTSLKTVRAGSTVTILFVNGVEKEYAVKGIFYTEFVQGDIRAYITEADYHAVVRSQPWDTAMSVHVKLADGADRDLVIGEVMAARPGLKYQTWEDALGVLKSMTSSFDQIINILRATALVVAAITIFIVTYVDLVNKRRQIGIERAIGITAPAIVLSYIIRAVVYAVVGIAAAVLVFLYVMVPLEARYPFHFSFGDVLLALDASMLTSSALILSAVAVVSAFVPAYQTIRTKIVDAIWYS